MLALFSRGTLPPIAEVHQMLQAAVSVDRHSADLRRADDEYRLHGQRHIIDILLTAGPLRAPHTRHHHRRLLHTVRSEHVCVPHATAGRTPDQFEEWLADCLTRLLLK